MLYRVGDDVGYRKSILIYGNSSTKTTYTCSLGYIYTSKFSTLTFTVMTDYIYNTINVAVKSVSDLTLGSWVIAKEKYKMNTFVCDVSGYDSVYISMNSSANYPRWYLSELFLQGEE